MFADMVLQDRNRAILSTLQSENLAEPADLARALHLADEEKIRIERVILRLGLVDEANLVRAVCGTMETAYSDDLSAWQLDRDLVADLGLPYLASKVIAPVVDATARPSLILADIGDFALRQELIFHLGHEAEFVGGSSALVRSLLAMASDGAKEQGAARLARDQALLRATDADGPAIRYVQTKLTDAVLAGASDIHFESNEHGIGIRVRINGILTEQKIDHAIPAASVIARLKILAEVNVAEKRLPQDGRFTTMIAGRAVDFRFSSLPTHWGESIVCRVLDPRALRLGWKELGFPEAISAKIRDIIERPSGLFLVTGPTGSGKTTTLYTALAHLNTVGRKIVTVEDPVEYNIPGVQQVQVHDAVGLSFARVLRGILRHDPNVILVGEIRDEETAEIACRAAQVGRMVLSTLHTSSADGAITRLIDLGVPEFIVRDVLKGVLAQSLEPVVCPTCTGKGCSTCSSTGFSGRKITTDLRQF